MKRLIFLGLLFSGFILSPTLVFGENPTFNLDFIIAGLKNRETTLRSLEGKFSIQTNTPEAKYQLIGEEIWGIAGKKERFDLKPLHVKRGGKDLSTSEIKKEYEMNVFDGETSTTLFPVQKRATIRRGKFFLYSNILNPGELCLYRFYGAPLSSKLESPGAQPELLGMEKIAGQDCCIVSFYLVKDGRITSNTVKLWVAVKGGFTPLKLEMTNNEGNRLTVLLSNLIQRDEVWFPQQVSYNSQKQEQLITEVLLSATQLKINESIPEEFFKIVFPSKTYVDDLIGGMNYSIP